MPRIELGRGALEDFERFLNHLQRFGAAHAPERKAEIIGALRILSHSPMIGRPVRGGKRELMIGRGAHGYVALYKYAPDIDVVLVLAVRSQREARYKRRR
jgi:plasmid stabilization system protein ParE